MGASSTSSSSAGILLKSSPNIAISFFILSAAAYQLSAGGIEVVTVDTDLDRHSSHMEALWEQRSLS
jgi:hypothetical protein